MMVRDRSVMRLIQLRRAGDWRHRREARERRRTIGQRDTDSGESVIAEPRA
jgi:hypothetical protein